MSTYNHTTLCRTSLCLNTILQPTPSTLDSPILFYNHATNAVTVTVSTFHNLTPLHTRCSPLTPQTLEDTHAKYILPRRSVDSCGTAPPSSALASAAHPSDPIRLPTKQQQANTNTIITTSTEHQIPHYPPPHLTRPHHSAPPISPASTTSPPLYSQLSTLRTTHHSTHHSTSTTTQLVPSTTSFHP